MADDHDPFGAGEGVFHRRKPAAQRGQLAVGEFVLARSRTAANLRRFVSSRFASKRQRKGYDVRLVGQLVHFSPTRRARNAAGNAPILSPSADAKSVARRSPMLLEARI